MQELFRPLALVTVALAVPIVPFALWGAPLERAITRWAGDAADRPEAALLVAGVLAVDVFLPVPSSLVSTVGGAKLGFLAGTLASWLGMTAGAALGLAVARRWGTPLARWLAGDDELERLSTVAKRYGVQTLVFMRPLPVVAEAAVLLLGASRVPWHRVAWPLALSNLGVAAAYSAAGNLALARSALPLAMALSVALPLSATVVARWWWRA